MKIVIPPKDKHVVVLSENCAPLVSFLMGRATRFFSCSPPDALLLYSRRMGRKVNRTLGRAKHSCGEYSICLNVTDHDNMNEVRNTVKHEVAHIVQFIIMDEVGHGKGFYKVYGYLSNVMFFDDYGLVWKDEDSIQSM